MREAPLATVALLFRCLPALALAAACGFQPIHAGPDEAPGPGDGRVLVETISGAAGFALRERLVERLGVPERPTHRLAVDLEIRQEGAALTRDDITTRYLVLGTAAFRLQPIGVEGEAIADAVAAQTAYSAPADDTASAFATRAAALAAEERVARVLADRIALRLSVLDWLEDAAAPTP